MVNRKVWNQRAIPPKAPTASGGLSEGDNPRALLLGLTDEHMPPVIIRVDVIRPQVPLHQTR